MTEAKGCERGVNNLSKLVMPCLHRRRGRDKTHRNWVETRQNYLVSSAVWTSHYAAVLSPRVETATSQS